eukprot:scaffold52262_cov20-Tisochrysis_lutea.AAC.3
MRDHKQLDMVRHKSGTETAHGARAWQDLGGQACLVFIASHAMLITHGLILPGLGRDSLPMGCRRSRGTPPQDRHVGGDGVGQCVTQVRLLGCTIVRTCRSRAARTIPTP